VHLVSVEHDLLEYFSGEGLTFLEGHAVDLLANGPGERGEAMKNASGPASGAVLVLEDVEIVCEVGHPPGDLPGSRLERLLFEEPALVGVAESLTLGSDLGEASAGPFDLTLERIFLEGRTVFENPVRPH
jgi:hypothetical protein